MKQRVRFCSSADGVRIAYAESGKGAALLRAANWFTHIDLDWQSPVWRHWFETLSHQRRLIRFDPRGCGLSDRNVDDFALDRWVQDLEAVVDAAGLIRFPLVGLCQGGAVAAAYAARNPERVSRLILYDSYAFGAFADGAPERLAQEAHALAQLIDIGWGKDSSAFHALFANLLMPDANRRMRQEICNLQRCSASARNARRVWDGFHHFDIRQLAPQIKAPTLVFHGIKDAMVPFEAGRHLASMIPNARFVPLETSNHILLPDEDAWQTFQRELEEFLQPETDAGRVDDVPLDDLTLRETQVLEAAARGLSNGAIGDLLRISEKTVRNHMTAVFSKLGLRSRAQAIIIARDAGLGRD